MKTRPNLTTERAGVNHVRSVVEGAGCLFKEINLQHDYGHDATIMLVVNNVVRPREIALQIKSGASYVSGQECLLPASAAHVHFWAEHDLITLGVVYDPDEKRAYWINLQNAARDFRRHDRTSGTTFRIGKLLWNRLDAEQFPSVLLPTLLGEAPTLPLETLATWLNADDVDTHDLGVRVIRARHYQSAAAWACLIDAFQQRPAERMTMSIGIALAKLLGHDDLGYYSGAIPEEVRGPAIARVLDFGADDIAKVLALIEDESFDRPSDGYSLLPILGARAESLSILAEIRDDPDRDERVRGYAAALLSHHDQDPDWWRFWRRDKTHR